MNNIKCGDCVHYHPQEKGSPKGLLPINSYALCKERSVYHADNPSLPEGAKTTTEPMAKPFVVTKDKLVPDCVTSRRA